MPLGLHVADTPSAEALDLLALQEAADRRRLYLQFYKQMQFIRVLEDELQKLCDLGEAGDLHLNKGQEAIAVGAMAAIRPTDYVATHHRTIAHAVAKGVPLYPLVAELLGKADGLCGGMSGEMHLSCPPVRFMFSFQLVASCVPVAAGMAWAARYFKKTDDIVVVFHGDAATGNGQWHEGLNIATVNRVPLLLVCENNHLAGNVHPRYYQPFERTARRADGYGIRSRSIDGTHVDKVFEAVQEAAEIVRRESRPYLLECDVERLCWHKQGQRDSRTPEELAECAKRDPLLYGAGALLNLSEDERASIFAEAKAIVDDVILRARAAAPPLEARCV